MLINDDCLDAFRSIESSGKNTDFLIYGNQGASIFRLLKFVCEKYEGY